MTIQPTATELHDVSNFLNRETLRMEQFQRARDIVARLASQTNAEAETLSRVEAAKKKLADVEAEIETAKGKCAAAEAEAKREIDRITRETEATFALAEQRRSEHQADLDAQIEARRAELASFTAALETVRAALG